MSPILGDHKGQSPLSHRISYFFYRISNNYFHYTKKIDFSARDFKDFLGYKGKLYKFFSDLEINHDASRYSYTLNKKYLKSALEIVEKGISETIEEDPLKERKFNPPVKSKSSQELNLPDLSDLKKMSIFANNLFKSVSKYVIGQDDSLKDLILNFITYLKKEETISVMLAGKTGTGKTFMCRRLSEELGIPFISLSMPEFTPEGYVGTNFLTALTNKLQDIGANNPNIVFLDEFDKLSTKHGDSLANQIQNELLKLLEDGSSINRNNTSFWNRGSYTLKVNSFFVLAGAFSHIDAFTRSEMIKHGFKPELIGRVHLLPPLTDLTKADYINILKNSKDSPLTYCIEQMESIGIEVEFKDRAIEFLAESAEKEGLGARTLKQYITALENLIKRDIIFDPIENSAKVEIVRKNNIIVTRDTIAQVVHNPEIRKAIGFN